MKIVQINSVCGVGSTGRIALNIYEAIQEQGDEGYIFYGRGATHEGDGNLALFSNKLEMYAHIAKTRLFDSHGFGSKKVTLQLIEALKKIKPDIIHLHNIHGYYLNIDILFNFLKEYNKSVVWTLHDTWSISGHSATIDRLENGSLPTKMGVGEKKDYPQTFFVDRWEANFNKKKQIFSNVKNLTIVTPSNWLADLVSMSYLSQYKCEVIHNGIDLSRFSNSANESIVNERIKKSVSKKMILGVASVWTKTKGLEYFNNLAQEYGDEFQLVVVGKIEKNQELDKKIIHIENTESIEELAAYYSLADVFFNPTTRDNFPTTNIESLACGTPVVTFQTGGSGESLTKDTGVICSSKSMGSIYRAILIASELNSDKCVEQSKLFSKEQMCKNYLNLYQLIERDII